MPRTVSTLLAVVGAVEYALPPIRVLLCGMSLAVPWLPRRGLELLCLFWCLVYLVPFVLEHLLERALPNILPKWMDERHHS